MFLYVGDEMQEIATPSAICHVRGQIENFIKISNPLQQQYLNGLFNAAPGVL